MRNIVPCLSQKHGEIPIHMCLGCFLKSVNSCCGKLWLQSMLHWTSEQSNAWLLSCDEFKLDYCTNEMPAVSSAKARANKLLGTPPVGCHITCTSSTLSSQGASLPIQCPANSLPKRLLYSS